MTLILILHPKKFNKSPQIAKIFSAGLPNNLHQISFSQLVITIGSLNLQLAIQNIKL